MHKYNLFLSLSQRDQHKRAHADVMWHTQADVMWGLKSGQKLDTPHVRTSPHTHILCEGWRAGKNQTRPHKKVPHALTHRRRHVRACTCRCYICEGWRPGKNQTHTMYTHRLTRTQMFMWELEGRANIRYVRYATVERRAKIVACVDAGQLKRWEKYLPPYRRSA